MYAITLSTRRLLLARRISRPTPGTPNISEATTSIQQRPSPVRIPVVIPGIDAGDDRSDHVEVAAHAERPAHVE